jgi:uncharacterized protein YndB with AHSA1/START domain
MQEKTTVSTRIKAPVKKVWAYWTQPEHITKWTFASNDWHVPHTENDVRAGGVFCTRMEAKDGSEGFDFNGVYTEVIEEEKISYSMEDGRQVTVVFSEEGEEIIVTETFDPETENPLEMQQAGWQAILENFKKYVELP